MAHSASTAPDDGARAAACCSAFYERDWVRQLANDSFHPGGLALTRRTLASMKLPAQASVLDLGCGTGTSALMLENEFGFAVTGTDLSAANISRARDRSNSLAIRFIAADACNLPFEDGAFDGVLSECVFSLLPDKQATLAEIRRVLKAGGRIGITDMAVAGQLPSDIANIVAPWTCLVDAMNEEAYMSMFETAGFAAKVADESVGLTTMIANLKRKLLLVSAGSLMAGGAPFDLATVKYWLDRIDVEVANGTIRYLRFQLQPT